jgi:hypothetical protein
MIYYMVAVSMFNTVVIGDIIVQPYPDLVTCQQAMAAYRQNANTIPGGYRFISRCLKKTN